MRKIKAYEISAETSPATTPATPTTGIASTPPSMGVVVGDIDSSDINMPRLNIVQGVGSLSELFSPGQVVMNQEIVLSNGTTPIELTVLAARKQFVENLAYDAESRPRVFDTLDEVHAAGGSINWIGNMRPSFVPVLHVNVLIKAPQGVEGSFPIHCNGEDYALAVWTLRGVAYGKAGKSILTAAKFGLQDGLYHGRWTLSTKREKFGRNSVFVPVLRNTGRHDADFVKFVTSLS